ncbi:hypothetical protein [Peptostreptococcus faecalis]|uniref:hypothetical protein n=1 Tax=Peptostreptococcus faecalis TaxID=2045015 RepID=UPI000C7E7A1B|nr:hypothetical protein [Peptostreptococcus faecalis]
MKNTKKIIYLLIVVASIFLFSHITPEMAIRTKLLTIFSGDSIPLILSDIEEFEDDSKKTMYIVKDENSNSPFANHYKWAVKKVIFFYLAEPIGKA